MSRGRKPKFYVFYDKDDFVKCFGTADDLFRDGTFKSKNYAKESAHKIKTNKVRGNVVVLPLTD